MTTSADPALNSTQINIGFVLWSLEHFSGSEKVVYDLAKRLDPRVYRLFILSIHDGPIRKIYNELGARVMIFPKKGRGDVRFMARMRKALIREKIHLVNAHHYMPLFWSFMATRRTDIKLVYTEHSRWQLEALELPNKILNALFLHRAHSIIAISHQIEDYYTNRLKLKSSKISFISNGIELSKYDNDRNHDLRREIGVRDHEKTIGMVATIKPLKNHTMMIDAVEKIRQKRSDVKLVLVGPDAYEGHIHRLVSQRGLDDHVLFLGSRKDVDQLLSIFDVFCLTSQYEGMPLSILEAMASRIPVIGTDVLGINEVIHHEKNGMLVPAGDDQSLAQSILHLLENEDLRERVATAGQDYVRTHFNIDDKIIQYDRLFRSLCN